MEDKVTISYIEIWDLLTNVQSLMNILDRKIQMQHSLTPQELRILLELSGSSSMNISELSRAINRDFGNVSRTCAELVKRELLVRYKDKDDKRITLVALTIQGENKLEAFREYNLSIMKTQILDDNKKDCETMIEGMRLFLSFVTDRMEALND